MIGLKLRPEVKERWLAALRSGEYRQGLGRLRDGDRFCCLGVLCDLAVREGVGAWKANKFEGSQGLSRDLLQFDVVAWAFGDGNRYTVAAMDPRVDNRGGITTLSYLNDKGYTFRQIADLVEESL